MLIHLQSKNIGIEIFKSMTMFDGVMDRLLSVIGITSVTEFHFSKLWRSYLLVNESKLCNIFTVDASQLDL